MLEAIRVQPFLVAIIAGTCAQLLKVLSFLIIEKRVNYRRFVQTHGSPNMHSAAFSALTTSIGVSAGFDSLSFAFAVCLTAVIVVDTMNVKNATSRQAEAIIDIMNRVRRKPPQTHEHATGRSYTPMDVFTGIALGIVVAMLFA
jgi:acid phosphatase family membrane protein YuiD